MFLLVTVSYLLGLCVLVSPFYNQYYRRYYVRYVYDESYPWTDYVWAVENCLSFYSNLIIVSLYICSVLLLQAVSSFKEHLNGRLALVHFIPPSLLPPPPPDSDFSIPVHEYVFYISYTRSDRHEYECRM